MRLTLVVPTYQERDNIQSFLRLAFEHVPQARILVVDDSSPDQTAQAVRDLIPDFPNLEVMVRETKDGLGRAYVAGFRRVLDSANADAVGMVDADFSHDSATLPAMLAALENRREQADIVVGSRYVKTGGVENWEPWRHALSSFGNHYARLVTRMPVNDATSGFNLIRTEALSRIPLASLRSSGYAFQIELKYRLWTAGARIQEVPITFHPRRGGESKITNHIVYEGILTPWRLRYNRSDNRRNQ